MGRILVDDLIPIIVIMALGWCLGFKWKGISKPFFDDNGRQALNKFVLNIALPAALFASIAKASRQLFVQDGVLTLISLIGT
ncbi:MAG: AEC family transporter, partial [Aeriscardovia sp.]|nr:AEC family transporter [Aeriscardovia sp.]